MSLFSASKNNRRGSKIAKSKFSGFFISSWCFYFIKAAAKNLLIWSVKCSVNLPLNSVRSIAMTNKTQQVSNWSWVWSFVNIPKFTCVWCALNLILQVNIILYYSFMCNLISLCAGGWTYYSCTIHITSCYFGFAFLYWRFQYL